ncbi:PMT family glycosyltransferase, 4-amino-4-deoxy-L-arabinose transferase [Desulfitobacterium dichloroeliminans LMG P-21439]|uniref:PMT family glycosyltransferase, 4-amino-4-deoxy-L-arabinose transferase n=1 Tax=Desulfitobacterium dichloroeliminans (strain LMG P-21439 / DCA1) TaxID=871963 RepID=L0F9T6_DESDL|nr:PMT family glycosyltransferase, 4-amino-4-deoxy-L-arabinose transferase [Desulfitobacterium dichloroeliminans LMG P-21439]
MGGMGQRVKGILVFILVVGVILRLQGVENPYLDDQGWRQADTASMALNMLGHLGDFPDVLFPTLNYDGSGPQPVELEFPFLPYLLAWTWTIFGWYDLWGRLWAISFSVLTMIGVYQFGKLTFSIRAGLWAVAFYAVIPLTTYYGRTVMPEPVAQAFSIWALIAVIHWRKEPSFIRLLGASLLMSGAILAKLPQLMIFPVALLLGFYPLQGRIGKMLTYSVLSLFLPMIYYSWVHMGAAGSSQFVSGIFSYQIMGDQNNYVQDLLMNLKRGLGFPTLLALMGMIIMIREESLKNEVHLAMILWAVVCCFYLGVICLKIPLDYYLVPIALPIALLAGFALDKGEQTPTIGVGVLILSLLLTSQYTNDRPKYLWDEQVLTQAKWIREYTQKESVLILSGSPPMTLYYAQRYGYRLISSDDVQAWLDLHTLSGDYLVVLPHSRGEEFRKRIEASFPQVGPGVYKIQDKI